MATISMGATDTKVRCQHKGCKWSGHIIVMHLREEHDQSAGEYLEKFPTASLASERGMEKLHALHSGHLRPPDRETELVDAVKLFGLPKDMAPTDGPSKGKLTVARFVETTEHTPDLNPLYIFPPEATKLMLMGLSLEKMNRIWIGGQSGTGKTELAMNVGALLHHEVFTLAADDAQSRTHLLGDWVVRNGTMEFQYGIIPIAMMRGATLVIDEIDSWNPRTFNIVRMLLTDRPKLVLLEKGGEVIVPRPTFRVMGTANTFGYGDDTGLYPTTNTLSVADRQRFNVYIRLDYLPDEVERKIIKTAYEDATEMEMDRFLMVAKKIRERHTAGDFEESFSPRQLLNWIDKYYLLGDEQEAAKVTFTNALPPHMAVGISEIIKSAWGSDGS
jgi:cobaltochelatase CobS